VEDDGKGFDTTNVKGNHTGLYSMHERVRKLNGKLIINSAVKRGSQVSVTILI
jgi:signal transduction histidine kinase